jgi:hypothetical protein
MKIAILTGGGVAQVGEKRPLDPDMYELSRVLAEISDNANEPR